MSCISAASAINKTPLTCRWTQKSQAHKTQSVCMATHRQRYRNLGEQTLQLKTKNKNIHIVYIRSNFSLRNSSTLSVFHLRMLSSSAMFPLSSKSFSTGSEPLTYCSVGGGEWEREKKRRGVRKTGLPSVKIFREMFVSHLIDISWYFWSLMCLIIRSNQPSRWHTVHRAHLDLKTLEHLRLFAPDKSWGDKTAVRQMSGNESVN